MNDFKSGAKLHFCYKVKKLCRNLYLGNRWICAETAWNKFSEKNSSRWTSRRTFNSSKLIFFTIWVLFHEHSRITGLQGKGEGIPLTPHYHFHPLHRHLDISRAITAESSPLHITSSRTWTGNIWFPSASC